MKLEFQSLGYFPSARLALSSLFWQVWIKVARQVISEWSIKLKKKEKNTSYPSLSLFSLSRFSFRYSINRVSDVTGRLTLLIGPGSRWRSPNELALTQKEQGYRLGWTVREAVIQPPQPHCTPLGGRGSSACLAPILHHLLVPLPLDCFPPH